MTSHDEIESTAARWLARRDAGTWSDARQRELEAWLATSTAHRVAFLRLESVWNRTHRLSALRGPEFRPAARASANRSRFAWAVAAGVAAVSVLGAGAGWHWLGRDATDFRTAVGERKPVVLADGTRIVLNTDTRLRSEIGSSGRGVRLDQGEAYFEVAHDAAHPFVIDAGDCTVTVLGTKFDVRRDGGTVRVTVVEGKVRVTPRGDAAGDRQVVLAADDSAVATTLSAIVVHRSAVDTAHALTWRSGRLSFDDTTLEAVALEFNRYNTRKLVVEGDRAAGIRIGGSFDATNLEAFAHLLHTGFGLTVRDDGQVIRVSG